MSFKFLHFCNSDTKPSLKTVEISDDSKKRFWYIDEMKILTVIERIQFILEVGLKTVLESVVKF